MSPAMIKRIQAFTLSVRYVLSYFNQIRIFSMDFHNVNSSTGSCTAARRIEGRKDAKLIGAFRCYAKAPKERYTLSVKLSDFTVWRHTWRENWVNCTVLTDNSAGLRTVFPVVFHIENGAVHSGNPTHIQLSFSCSFFTRCNCTV